mmetsp:Transcript_31100/g.60882  ORF Transcript_31100/g.60882 Transcript_31100/m.60882 type:complete len:261 (-) Transcript_31100:296-1078(-)
MPKRKKPKSSKSKKGFAELAKHQRQQQGEEGKTGQQRQPADLEREFLKVLRGGKDSSSSSESKRIPIQDGIFEIGSLFSERECRECITLAESVGFELREHKATKWTAHRCNGRIQFNSVPLSELLWTRCARHFTTMDGNRVPCGLNPNFRLYRYLPGQRFGEHIDESVDISPGVKTLYTLLVYLNASGNKPGDVVGGETIFYKGSKAGKGKVALKYPPKMGFGLAHIHGERCMLHEGAEVKKGVKYLLRTDVCYASRQAK